MEYFEDGGRLYEFCVLSPVEGDDYEVECFDRSADGPGLVGTLFVDPAGVGRLVLEAEAPVRVLRRWLGYAEGAAGLAGSDG
jgi:hypothetical protein